MADAAMPQGFENFVRQQVEDRVDSHIAEILASANFPEMNGMLARHESIIHGNGRPGLVEQIAVIDSKIDSLEKSKENTVLFETEVRKTLIKNTSIIDSLEKSQENTEKFETETRETLIKNMSHNEAIDKSLTEIQNSLHSLTSFQAKLSKMIATATAFVSVGSAIIVALGWVFDHWDKIKLILGIKGS